MADREGGKSKKRELPDILPVFPLRGTLLLPGCRLPLRVFEPRYLQMVEDALEGDRLIGIIQPAQDDDAFEPELQQIGCAGRVASVKQSEGGEYMIGLVGVARFGIRNEISSDKLYRLVEPDWHPIDKDGLNQGPIVDREELVANLRTYFDTHGLEANWQAIEASLNAL